MATLTTLLNETYASKDGTFPILIRVEHAGRRRKIPIGYKVEKKHWKGSNVNSRHPQAMIINSAISEKEAEIRRYLADCKLHGKPVHLDLIGTGRVSYSFTDYLRRRSQQYETAGKIIMKRKVSRFVDELLATAGREVYFEDINLDFLRQLEAHQIKQSNVENTRHKKFKFLREFYSQAVKEGKAVLPNPFEDYKIVTKPVKKEKLTEAEVKAIESLQLSPGPIADARNLWLFSYYAKGQRFEVCAILRRDQVANGRIFFRTNKGNEHISVKIHGRLQAILDLYLGDPFIFPFIKELPTDPEEYINLIASRNTIINRNLKIVATLAGISKPLTFHIARHSFAFQLKQVSDNVNVIQDALGHSDQRTTQIYLKALEDERLDGEMEKLYGK